MSDQNPRANLSVLVLTGIGAGVLTGAFIGLLVLRRPHVQAQEEMSETVDDLKRRAELILTELSRSHDPSRPAQDVK